MKCYACERVYSFMAWQMLGFYASLPSRKDCRHCGAMMALRDEDGEHRVVWRSEDERAVICDSGMGWMIRVEPFTTWAAIISHAYPLEFVIETAAHL